MSHQSSARRKSSSALAASSKPAKMFAGAGSDPCVRLKPIQKRRRLSRSERATLESRYVLNRHPSADERRELAIGLNMPLHTVQIWFQNRRAKEKADARQAYQLAAEGSEGSPSSASSNAAAAAAAAESRQQQQEVVCL